MAASKDAKPTSKAEKIEVKSIAGTDLSPDEIAKAIEATAAAGSTKQPTQPPAAESDAQTIEVKRVPAESDKPTAEPLPSQPEPAAAASEPAQGSGAETESQAEAIGSPATIVKRHGGYIQPPSAAAPEPTPDTDTPKVAPPPTAPAKVVAVSSVEEPTPDQPVVATDDRQESPKPVTPVEPEPAVKSEPATAPTPAAGATDSNEPDPDQETEPQNPTVFDTNQYHLPIKARASHHYLNAAVTWVILLLVLAAVSAYVLWKLEVLRPADLLLFQG